MLPSPEPCPLCCPGDPVAFDFDQIIPRRHTDCLKYDELEARYGRAELLPLWVADMDFRVAPCVTAALQRLVDHGVYGYHVRRPRHQQAIVDWWGRRHGYTVHPEAIVYTPGVVPVLSHLVQALTGEDDGVLVQSPVYYPFFWLPRVNRRRLVINPLIEHQGDYQIDFDDLEAKAAQARILIFSSPHNPVGRVWRPDELERVASICLRHGLVLVADEIHNDLVFAPHRHTPVARLSPEIERITVTAHAASKTFNLASLATAYVLIADAGLRARFAAHHEALAVDGLNPFGLEATVAAFNEGEPWLAELLVYLRGNYQYLCAQLQARLPQVRVGPLEGTYLAWLDCRATGLTPPQLRQRLVEVGGLALNDGPIFGPGGEGFQRLNLACPRATLAEAVARLERALALPGSDR